MQLLPHAFPFSQTMQHSSRGVHFAGSRVGPATETHNPSPNASVRSIDGSSPGGGHGAIRTSP